MATTLPFRYAHMWQEMRKGIDGLGPYYEVDYLFDNWSDSDAAANALKGITTYTGGAISRGTPHQHPLSPNLYCKEAHIEGVGAPVLNGNGYPSYDSGFKVRAVYRPTTWEGVIQMADDPDNLQQIDPTTPQLWCTQELDFDTETVVVPNNNYKWFSDSSLAGVPVTIRVGITTMRLTFHRVPFMPTPTLRQYRGKVNNATFLGGDPKKVLFKGGSTVREASTDGTVSQRVTLVFLERDVEWTKYMRRDKLMWDTIQDGTGTNTYTTADLSQVLKPFAG